MICLTGDVHHTSLRINDQRYIARPSDTEIKIAARYLALVESYGLKVTFYICGRCFTEEWEDLAPIVKSPLVEVGGHGHRARQPRPLFDWYGARTGNWNGPRWYQDWDIRTMSRVCEERAGYRPVSWRAHSYKVDPNTYRLLAKHGYRLVSDEVRARNVWPERIGEGLISHPMNTIPDHDHLYHAHRTPEYVDRINAIGYGADEFGAVSYPIERWGDLVLERVEEIESAGGLATVLAHPLCMYLADGFKTFKRLLERFARSRCIHARDIINIIDSDPAAGAVKGEVHYGVSRLSER